MATEAYDELERRPPETRERELFRALPGLIAHARAQAPYYGQMLADIAVDEIVDRAALARLPVTRKSELHELHRRSPPFGGLLAVPAGQLARIFVSPGPTYDPEGRARDYWRSARALFAAGFRAGDIVQNCFSYHLTPAGSMFETGLAELGCAVIPAGTGQTEIQVTTMAALRVTGYVGTPSFLKLILDKATELGADLGALRVALVSAEPFLAPVRELLQARRIDAYEVYGTADLGLVAYQTSARAGLVVDEGVIVELVRPGTGEPVADGDVGELVVTSFSREYPLIRFATGDLSRVVPGPSPCGRTNMRIAGWMGRADQVTKVRGQFVHPHHVAEVLRRVPAVRQARVVVENQDGADRMRVLCVLADVPGSDELRGEIERAIRDVTRLRGEVEFVEPGALPGDGKVIVDERSIG